MLTPHSALALQDAGIVWSPVNGDRFFVPDRDLDDSVFVVSDMTIDVVEVPHSAPILAFNGTTEWALDSLEAADAVWVPREDQLRDLLGATFVSLERLEGLTPGFAVTIDVGDAHERHVDVSAEAAYARALLALLAP